jgi:hypothetical protein
MDIGLEKKQELIRDIGLEKKQKLIREKFVREREIAHKRTCSQKKKGADCGRASESFLTLKFRIAILRG